MFNQNAYGQYGGQPAEPLAFYQGSSSSTYGAYGGQQASGSMGSMGNMGGYTAGGRIDGMMADGKWWEAFGTGGFEGEPSLMEGGWEGGDR